MNSTLEGIHSRIMKAEAQINDLGDKMVEITIVEQNIEKRMRRNENSLRDIWDNIKLTNLHNIGPQKEEREKGPEKRLEEKKLKTSQHGKENNQPSAGSTESSRINPRRNTPRYIVIKLTKIKDRDKILKATRDK